MYSMSRSKKRFLHLYLKTSSFFISSTSFFCAIRSMFLKNQSCLDCLLNQRKGPYYSWIFLDLLVSVSIHVVKIITWDLPDVWHINFSSDPTNILLCVGIDVSFKSTVKFKFYAQPMHQIYYTKYCILLKTSLSE